MLRPPSTPKFEEPCSARAWAWSLPLSYSPVLAAAAVGAGIGAVIGNIADQIDAFKHTDMREIERLVDDSAANLIVIANGTTIDEIAKVATRRGRRIVVPFSDADVDVLERELQRVMTMGGPQGV